MLILSELIWLTLYVITIYYGILFSDITLLTFSFFILGFSGLEFSIGMLISILFKNLNESLNIDINNKKNNQTIFFKNFKNYKNII